MIKTILTLSLSLSLILVTTSVFAAEPGALKVLNVDRNAHSRFVFLMLDCLATNGLYTNYRLAAFAFEHCQSEATTNADLPIVYNNLSDSLLIDLDRYHNSTSELLVCFGKFTKNSEDETVQRAQFEMALRECNKP